MDYTEKLKKLAEGSQTMDLELLRKINSLIMFDDKQIIKKLRKTYSKNDFSDKDIQKLIDNAR